MLTYKELEKMEPRRIIGAGYLNDPRLYKEGTVKWVAVRGQAPDWAIYYHHVDKTFDFVAQQGEKIVFSMDLVRELIPCTDEVFKKYRY